MSERDGIHPHGYPVYAWEPWSKPSIVHLTLGQDRHEEHPEPLPPRRPVGFAPPPEHVEPLTWEGDGA
jgi:hypothetical protein